MRTKAILLKPVFVLILLVSFSTGSQNSTQDNNMTSTQTLGYSQSPTGATQTNTTTTSSPISDSRTTFAPSSAKNTTSLNISSSSPPPTHDKRVKMWLIVILLVIIVLMGLVAYFHHVCQQSDHSSSVPRFLLDVRERLRTWIRNLEDHLGVQLWPGDKRTAEDAMEETEGGQAEEGEVWEGNCGEGANSGLSNKEEGEHKEEDSDTSDDYSSLEGDDLRERALNRQNEEEGNQSKDEDETSTSSDEGQCHSEGMSGGNQNEDSEETALVISPPEDDLEADLCDVTAL